MWIATNSINCVYLLGPDHPGPSVGHLEWVRLLPVGHAPVIPFLSSDPEIMAELWTWFLRTNTGIDHICYLKTLERCYFVQIILLSHLCPRNRFQCINYRSMPVKSQQKATRAFDDQNQNACHGECARSREKMDRNWHFSLWVRPTTPFCCNGNRFLESYHKVCAVWSSISRWVEPQFTPFPAIPGPTVARNQWPRSNPNQLFDHQNRFPLLEIGVLRHPVNGFERFAAVFSAECAHCRHKISGHDLDQMWLRMGSRISGLSWCDSPYQSTSSNHCGTFPVAKRDLTAVWALYPGL